jgi:hypothetical protein
MPYYPGAKDSQKLGEGVSPPVSVSLQGGLTPANAPRSLDHLPCQGNIEGQDGIACMVAIRSIPKK